MRLSQLLLGFFYLYFAQTIMSIQPFARLTKDGKVLEYANDTYRVVGTSQCYSCPSYEIPMRVHRRIQKGWEVLESSGIELMYLDVV